MPTRAVGAEAIVIPIYVLVPGYVTSKNDGDIHYINARRLRRLYGVDPAECIEAPTGPGAERWEPPTDAVYLHPRYDGDYSLPAA